MREIIVRIITSAMEKMISKPRLIIRIFVWLVLNLVCVFGMSGGFGYWQGWLYLVIYFFLLGVNGVVFRRNLDLLAERMKPGPGVKGWDKIFVSFMIVTNLIVIAVSSLDAGRMHWSPKIPWSMTAVAIVIFLSGYAFLVWCMLVNRFFSSVVRIQTDRGHHVIDKGPYKIIRHPGYFSALFVINSIPVILGSYYGLIPSLILSLGFIVRTHLEDKTLRRELIGYEEYCRKTKWRLVPFLW